MDALRWTLIAMCSFIVACDDNSGVANALVGCKEQYAGKTSQIDLREKVIECMKIKKFTNNKPDWENANSYTKN